jgi:hypothetical protein
MYCTGKQNGACQDKSSPLLNHRSRAEYIEIKESSSENNIKLKAILLEAIESRSALSVRELIDSAITCVTSKFCRPRDLDENLDEMLMIPLSGVFFRLS